NLPLAASARDLLLDIPHDRPPTPALSRGLRNLARALAARKDPEPAREAVAAAWRGLQDFDSALLGLELADPASSPAWLKRVRGSFRRELSNLQGPLARGLLCARWPAAMGSSAAVTSLALTEGEQLLSIRSLEIQNPLAAHYRAQTAQLLDPKQPDPPPLPAGVPWDELLPPTRARASISKKDRKAAMKAARVAALMPRRENAESEKACRAVLVQDPWCYTAQWELGTRRARLGGPGSSAGHLHVARLRLRPGRALATLWQWRSEWIRGFLATSATPVQTLADVHSGKLPSTDVTPADLDATQAVVFTVGRIYPDDKRPAWPSAPATTIRALVGGAIRKDPLYLGLLYLDALLLGREGYGPAATRNLDLLRRLAIESLTNRAEQPIHYQATLFEAWIRAPYDPNAGQLLASLKLTPPDKDLKIGLVDWIRGVAPDELKTHPAWPAFSRRAKSE
ncbi:MAG: hypothetical protein JKY65_07665, partial [Planctomycetes bacterium]|nr:hypothetical protein [Planctomycetota bacterium]